jgi:uncharacterized membrane protein YvlD (DUF360 family)
MSLYEPLRDTWSTSLSVARQRIRSGGRRRLLLAWILQALALYLVGQLVPGFVVTDPIAALLGAVVVGLLNALVRPILVLLTLPLSVLTMGLVSLVINAIMLVIAAPLVPGLEVQSFGAAVLGAVMITIFTTLISVILASDQDDTFYAELARRLTYRESERVAGGSGLIVVQIDGLAAPILRNAIRVGITPRMANWVRSGQYRLVEWECVPPSQTSASQAGILHGNNDNIPAFRWFEKETGRLLVSNRPADATEIERRASDGRGLLAAGGTSVGNLFSGDATRTLFTMSRMGPESAADVSAFSLYFVDPAAFIRTVVLTITEVVKERLEARRQVASDIQPRVHRGATFAVLRAVSNVVLRDLNVTFVMDAMRRGTPIVYVDMVDYDELAHHAGPERLESLRSLAGVDRVLGSLQRAAASAPRDYRIVVVSDHGQSQGATFKGRYGATLAEVIEGLMGAGTVTSASTGPAEQGEGWGPVNALLSEIRSRPGVTGKVASSVFESRTVDGAVDLGAKKAAEAPAPADATVMVLASGNLANAYFTGLEGRASLERLEETYPGLLTGLAAHPGIGFILARSEALGAVALGPAGARYLDDDRVEGVDPLALFGPNAADHLRRLDGFSNVGDLLINSSYDAELEEVAAFEELVGSHGGFGGPQTRPFLLAPAELEFTDEPIVGAPAVYRQLVRWADGLGVGPGSGAGDSPEVEDHHLPEPKGIKWVAALLVFASVPAILFAGAILILEIVSADVNALATAAVVIALLIASASIGLAIGLLKRRRWAWFATLVIEGINVVAMLIGLATEGLGAVASYGVMAMVVAFTVFFYLTRPHVAAAFKRPRAKPSPGAPAT